MVEITLKNGSKFQIQTLVFHGKIIDSNGTEPGGNATYPFTESDVNALNNLGIALQEGKATPPDHTLAVECYYKAVEKGSPQAYYNLARCYELGLGVERDLKRAAELYGKAADFGIKEALAGLARMVKRSYDYLN